MKIDLEQAREAGRGAFSDEALDLVLRSDLHTMPIGKERSDEIKRIFATANAIAMDALVVNIAAQMEAAGVKCVSTSLLSGRSAKEKEIADAMIYAGDAHGVGFMDSTPEVAVSDMWRCGTSAAPCLFQTAVKGDG